MSCCHIYSPLFFTIHFKILYTLAPLLLLKL
nr:MAG TPA: hypothetical protein [Caudoviricetes sp.]